MLRIFKQYYPIRNALFVFGEGVAIFFAVIIASNILLEDNTVLFHFDVVLKALLITAACQV
jgi:hypothetical protein